MEFIQIPCIGDVIIFSDNWQSHVKVYSNLNSSVSPYGLVTNIDTKIIISLLRELIYMAA
jgi:hypothetical protein